MKVFGILLAGVSFAAFASSAFAADMPMPDPAPVVVDTAAGHDWTGFYAGVFTGYGTGNIDWDANYANGGPGPEASGDFDMSGWLLGATLGYNQQLGQFVVGAETDLAWTGLSGEGDAIDPGGPDPSVPSATLDWLGTVRVRGGITMDSLLIYATGGLAYGGGSISISNVDSGPADDRSRDTTLFGWTAGVGAELAVTDNISVKAEYLYANLATGDVDFGNTVPGGTLTANGTLGVHTFRVGLNVGF